MSRIRSPGHGARVSQLPVPWGDHSKMDAEVKKMEAICMCGEPLAWKEPMVNYPSAVACGTRRDGPRQLRRRGLGERWPRHACAPPKAHAPELARHGGWYLRSSLTCAKGAVGRTGQNVAPQVGPGQSGPDRQARVCFGGRRACWPESTSRTRNPPTRSRMPALETQASSCVEASCRWGSRRGTSYSGTVGVTHPLTGFIIMSSKDSVLRRGWPPSARRNSAHS